MLLVFSHSKKPSFAPIGLQRAGKIVFLEVLLFIIRKSRQNDTELKIKQKNKEILWISPRNNLCALSVITNAPRLVIMHFIQRSLPGLGSEISLHR